MKSRFDYFVYGNSYFASPIRNGPNGPKNQKSKIRYFQIENNGFCFLQNWRDITQSATEDGHPHQKIFSPKILRSIICTQNILQHRNTWKF